jgi:uncharacterized membrane protein YbhN (UPF0104 family)
MNRQLKTIVRLVVGASVIGVLIASTDVGDIAKVIGHARVGFVLLAVILSTGVVAVSAFRWQVFLRPLGTTLPTATALRMYFVGTFFNAFLPTGIGGDAYKAFRLRREPGSLSRAFASVFLDRAAGMAGLALIGAGGAVQRVAAGDRGPVVVVSLGLSAAMLAGMALLFVLSPRIRATSTRPSKRGIGPGVRSTAVAMARAARDRRALRGGLAGGLAAQGLVLGMHAAVAAALAQSVPIGSLAGIAVLATLASTIPLTVNGLGFREGTYVWALGAYGVSHAAALAFALLMLASLLGASALGGLVYLFRGGDVSRRGLARGDQEAYLPGPHAQPVSGGSPVGVPS